MTADYAVVSILFAFFTVIMSAHSNFLRAEEIYRLIVLRALRGRPTFRSFTASRSFGLISHTFPTLMAFKRPLSIIARILLGETFKRLAASVVLMIFMAQSIAFCRNCAVAQ